LVPQKKPKQRGQVVAIPLAPHVGIGRRETAANQHATIEAWIIDANGYRQIAGRAQTRDGGILFDNNRPASASLKPTEY
jgi:hypothetical protein